MASNSKSSSARTARRPRRSPARRFALAAGAILLTWIAATGIVRATYADRVMPGTTVGGVDLGGASTGEARARLESVFGPGRRVMATVEGRRYAIDPGQAGYRFDVEATLHQAGSVGRDGPLGGLWSTLATRVSPRELEPVVRLDGGALAARIAEIAGEVDRPVSRGALVADPSAPGGIGVVAPRRGLTVERGAAARAVAGALRERRASAVALPVRRQASVDPERVRAVARRARAYVRTPLRLRVGDGTRTLDERRTAGLLALERSGRGVRLGIDAQAAQALVGELAGDLDREAKSARIVAPAQPAVVVREQGELTWRPRRVRITVGAARAGRALRREAGVAAIAEAVRGGRHEARLSFERLEPRVTAAAARKVDALLGTFTTPYVCCQPRVKNIGLMAKEVDGFVVLPGERFSLNGATGERTKAEGYVPAPYIADGEIKPSVGGGVSQFSTTLYNAAFFAGLRIETHRPHSFYIDRYPPGREATLNYPDIDMAWTNDTSAPVIVRTLTDATSVTASIYGADHGRRVRASNGDRVALDGGDFSITVTRVLRYRDGKVDREPFTTRYERPPPPE